MIATGASAVAGAVSLALVMRLAERIGTGNPLEPSNVIAVTLSLLLAASVIVIGIWTWFLSRRFLARFIAPWQAWVPFILWNVGLLLAAILATVFDADFNNLRSGSLPIGDTAAEAGNGEAQARFERVLLHREINRIGGMIMAGTSIAAALFALVWTFRALGRDARKIADEFD